MSVDMYENKRVKTRKPHICDYCYSDISAGTEVVCESGLFDGQFFRRYCCDECNRISGAMWEYCDYECGSIADTMREFIEECLYSKYSRDRYRMSIGELRKQAERLNIPIPTDGESDWE